MRDRYIPAIITLIAGAVVSVGNIMNKVELDTGLKRLLIVLLIFYVVGLVARAIIMKTINDVSNKKQENETQEQEEQFEEQNSLEGNEKI